KADFLRGRRARFTDVVTTDRNRIPLRYVFRAVSKDVADDPERRRRREDVRPTRDVLLEDVVLDRAVQLIWRDALLFRHRDVHRQENRRGGVDRHARRNLVQRDAIEQGFHVGQRVDGNAYFTDFARGDRIV